MDAYFGQIHSTYQVEYPKVVREAYTLYFHGPDYFKEVILKSDLAKKYPFDRTIFSKLISTFILL